MKFFINLAILFLILPNNLVWARDVDDTFKSSLADFLNINKFSSLKVCEANPRANDRDCPAVVVDSYKDIYTRGTAGVINQIVSNGELKNPRSVCASSAKEVSGIKTEELNMALASRFPGTVQLSQISGKCNQSINDEKGNLAANFMAYDFQFKTNAIAAALTDLLNSDAQIKSMKIVNNDTKTNCQEIKIESVRKHCEELNGCSQISSKKLFLLKKAEVAQALTTLQEINNDYNNQISILLKEKNPANREKIKVLEETRKLTIEEFKKFNPLIAGDKFKKLLKESVPSKAGVTPKPLSDIEIGQALIEQLSVSQDNIKAKIKDFIGAYNCLIGNSSKCDNFNDIIKQSKFYNHDGGNNVKGTIGIVGPVANFYQCTASVKDSRDSADKVLNESLISAALTVTPMVVVSGARLGLSVARIATLKRAENITAAVLDIEKGANAASLGANVLYGGHQTKEIFEQCKEEHKRLDDLGNNPKGMSCGSIDNIMVSKAISSSCTTQALLSAAALTPLAAPQIFKLARLAKIPKSAGDFLRNQNRLGKSLTASEEAVILGELKARPLKTILENGISPENAQFAENALARIYKQETLSAEEYMRLSTLVKNSDSPLLAITQQNNVKDILKSGRLWGNTEGSVYASSRPIVTTFDKIKTGHLGNGEGTFIFAPPASSLFKPHEIDGAYSALKNAAGQYKGPFGDIVIEKFTEQMVNGKPVIIITKARRADPNIGEVLHAGTNIAALKLAGRKYVLENVANAGVTSAGYGAAKAAGLNPDEKISRLIDELED